MKNLTAYSEVQAIAKAVLSDLARSISAIDTESTIAARAVSLLAGRGITETWYYDCPAFVLLGSRSCLSVSGKSYSPTDEPVGPFNLVTVDLSPSRDGIWGDCARSFPIENGRCTFAPQSPVLACGMDVETRLHQAMRAFVTPDTTFEALFTFGNAEIKGLGFENLDFLGNLGHSIPLRREDRSYIEPKNTMPLSAVPFFTFEPHVRQIESTWGFKHENIYYFDSQNRLLEL
jgi:Xaa-Pro aminopeptidase